MEGFVKRQRNRLKAKLANSKDMVLQNDTQLPPWMQAGSGFDGHKENIGY